MKKNLYALSACLLMASAAQAGVVNWTGAGTDSEWNTVGNWNAGYLPGSNATDRALLSSGDHAIISSVVSSSSAIDLDLQNSATLAVSADFSRVRRIAVRSGTVTQTAGAVESEDGGSSSYLGNGGSWAISGGSYGMRGDLEVRSNGTFSVIGSAPTASVGNGAGDNLTLLGGGALNFTMDASGVSAIDVFDTFSVDSTASLLTIDASAYTGTNKVIELVRFSSVSGNFDASQILITGLGAEHEPATIVYDGDSMNLELAETDPNWEAVMALGNLTNAPTMWDTNGVVTTLSPGEIKEIFYEGQDYTGSPTRVYAWISLPAGASVSNPVPAMVAVHGGGGTAFKTWVEKWNERGYAAIAMDTEGKWPDPVTGDKVTHEWSGPKRTGIYDDMAKPIGDQFMYHATADAILANSLLGSLPEVNADQVGIIGVSWGGVITSTAIGIDDRFMFAIPTYGCGHLYDASSHWGPILKNNEMYKTVWDPVLRLSNATMPVMWFSFPTETTFPMDSFAYSYHAAAGQRMVSLVPGMGHAHGATWTRPESYDFADSIISNGSGWCVQQSLSLTGSSIQAVFITTKTLKTASLLYATGNGNVGELPWTETNVTSLVESPVGTWTVTAQLPTNASGWFVKTTADANVSGYRGGDVIAGSDYQEVIKVTLEPSSGFEMSHPLPETVSTGTLQVDFTAPTNLEIVDVVTANESLTYAGDYPFVLNESGLLGLTFDNTVAGLAAGETATGTVQVVWEHLDGSPEMAELPFTVTARAAETVVYEVSTNWSSKSVYEIDDVIVRSNATVSLDQLSAAGTLTISDGELVMDQNHTLTLTDSLSVEADGALSILDGEMDLNSGAFVVDGLVTIDGGALTWSGSSLSGSGKLVLESGDMTVGSSTVTSIDLIEVSGGTVDFGGGHCQFGNGGATEFRVVGDTASITMGILNQKTTTGANGTFRFVFNETGISPINVTSYMHLPAATIVVDGSAYTGGADAFPLIDSPNFITLGELNNFSATGFEEQGLSASFVQDQAAGADWVQLVLTETAYGSWIRGFVLSGADLSLSANPDGDAYTNEEEYIAGLNPGVFDAFEISSISNGDTLEWSAVSGRLYNVYWASNLVDGFTLIGSNMVDGSYIDPEETGNAQGFYKITVELEP